MLGFELTQMFLRLVHMQSLFLEQGFPNWGTCTPRGTFEVSNRREKICLYITHFKLFMHMNSSEQFHVTNNGVIQGGVWSPYLFAVYLDGLSLELNNIKSECYICEILLDHLMSADDICVSCPSVLQSMLDGCQV